MYATIPCMHIHTHIYSIDSILYVKRGIGANGFSEKDR